MDQHLLLIREDASSMRHVTDVLRERGYTVATVSNFEFAIDPGFAENFDLIVVDHSEPRLNALNICTELRERNVEAPVVVLAERDQAQDRVAIFKAGADDYLLKPLDLDELHARIEALLARWVRRKKPEISSYAFGGVEVDFCQSELIRNRSIIQLSERESRLLRYFVENRGKTISRSALLQHVWGYRYASLTRTVDVHVMRLRHKIEENPKDPRFLVTVPGLGYRFDG
ncbi:MAG TPA: response regulator transcription factor [Terriglobia bacterium]|nr:response regulator transcription factor [Terriglobia bacterium]